MLSVVYRYRVFVAILACLFGLSSIGCGTKDFVLRADYDNLLDKVENLSGLLEAETASAKQSDKATLELIAMSKKLVQTENLHVINEKGESVVMVYANKHGDGSLVVCNGKGSIAAMMEATEDDGGKLSIHNARERIVVNVSTLGDRGSISISDTHQVAMMFSANANGDGEISMNVAGAPTFVKTASDSEQ